MQFGWDRGLGESDDECQDQKSRDRIAAPSVGQYWLGKRGGIALGPETLIQVDSVSGNMEDSSSLVPAESGPADSVSLFKLAPTVGHKERDTS